MVDSFDDKIYAYNLNTKARDSAKDFNTLAGSSLKRPYGLWSDGTTMWVADYFEEKIFAYSMSTKARDESKDFNTLTAAGNREPFGIWSDGTTMWVADFGDEKLYAYDMSTKARDSAKDFGTLTAAGNGSPRGLWADGTTMWIADVADNKIYAYTMSTKARESANDIVGLADHGNDRSWGIWSNGRTIWVSDTTDKKLYAYRLPARAPSAPTGLTATAGGVTVIDLSWTDGGAGTAAAAASYGIEVSTAAGTTWNDLVANTMSPATTYRHMGIPAETTRHYRVFAINEVGISTAASNVADATTTAPTTVTGAPTGLTATADGRTQISLSWTAPAPTVTGGSATSYQIQVSTDGGTTWTDLVEDTMSTTTTYSHTGLSPGTARHYRVWAINALGTSSAASNVASAATAFFARDSAKDITLDSANGLPQGIWSDGTTIWVANFGFAGNTPKLFAYTLSDGARDSAKDFNTLSAAGNTAHQGLWSDGTTMWVADATDDKIYAYNLSTRARDSAKDFNNLAAGGNSFPAGIWSNGNTMWVADAADDKIYAYNLSTKARDSARDNDALAAASNSPVGIWSDGTTMWVMNQDDKKLYAYSLPAAPGAPTSLTATADGQTEIDLSWTAPESTDAGATAASYQIEVSLDRGANWSVLVADTGSTATTYSHTGLVAGTTRHYRVSAVNSDGTGSASNTANATTAAPTTATGAPTALTATAVGQTQIDLSWTAPTPTATGGAAASYKIEVSADEGTNWTDLVADTGNAATTYSHTGLTVGSARHYRVSAINSFGTGSASGTASATTPAPPDAPTALTATADGQTKIDLSWTAPAGGTADHKAATSYKIEVSTDGGTNWNQLVADTGSTATTYSHTGLVAGTTRHYRVSAINSVGTSSASATASATTAAPTTGPGAPTNLTAAVPSKTQIDLSWTAPAPTTTGGVATGYRIEVSADGGTTWTNLVANTNSAATTYSHTGLEPGDMRHYRVSAIGAGGTGSPSNEVSASTAAEPPGAPTGLTATAVGQTRIDLSWTDASAGSNLAATSYRIEVSTDEGENWTDLVANTHSAATTAKHRGVPAGATRHYRVSGINPAGTGSPSTAASATTAVPTTPPDAPTGLTATANGQTRIDLSWTAPAATPAGGSAAGYRIEASPSGNDDTWTTLVTDTGTTATTYSHTGLTAGTLRHYRVSAVNSVGASGPSNTAFATTAMPSVSLHADNGAPYGIWSDGTTMCVLDNADARIYAYNLATGARDEGKEFDTFSDLARIHRRVVASLPDRGLRAWQDGGESMTPALERSEGPRS